MSQRPVVSKRGLAVLDKAFAAMRRWPDTVDMSDWVYYDDKIAATPRRPAPYCKVVACFAGHFALAATGRRPTKGDWYNIAELPKSLQKAARVYVAGGRVSCANLALSALGIPEAARDETWGLLFLTSGWPGKFLSRYNEAPSGRERAGAVIARVRHWLKTGE